MTKDSSNKNKPQNIHTIDNIDKFAREIMKENGENIGIDVDGTRYTAMETKFSIHLAEGFIPQVAYDKAGYSMNYSPKMLRKQAIELSNRSKIRTLVGKLREVIAEHHAMSLNTIINELIDLKDRAKERGYYSIELKCLQELSKIFSKSTEKNDNRIQQVFQFSPNGEIKAKNIDSEENNGENG